MARAPRAFSFGELLDGAFTLYRRNFAVLFMTALLPQLPIVLFWLVAPALVGGAAVGTLDALTILIMPVNLFAIVLAMGALTHGLARAYGGERPALGEALLRGLQRWLPLAAATIIAWFSIMIGMFIFVVPGLILLSMWFAIYPAVVLESRGPFGALGRSRRISKGGRMRILGVTIVAWLITLAPTVALWTFVGIGAGARAAMTDGSGFDALWLTSLTQAGSTLLAALTWPFLMGITVLLYYDRLARTEAPDLEEAAASLQPEQSF